MPTLRPVALHDMPAQRKPLPEFDPQWQPMVASLGLIGDCRRESHCPLTIGLPDLALSKDPGPNRRLRLRLIATTDLHMCIGGGDAPDEDSAPMARVAAEIARLKGAVDNCLIFDNGDTLQGGAAGEFFAAEPKARDRSHHPMIAVMNTLEYDAAALGNHDFDFGLGFLKHAISAAHYPVLCANVEISPDPIGLAPSALLKRTYLNADGQGEELSVGVVGLVPPGTVSTNWATLDGRAREIDAEDAMLMQADTLRSAGADLIIGLCHMGIDDAQGDGGLARRLARAGDADALVLGHTHSLLADPGPASRTGTSGLDGSELGVPAVLAGSHGSHVGVIDLDLERRSGGWKTTAARSSLHPVAQSDARCPERHQQVAALLRPARVRMQAELDQVVGQADTHLHSYFAQLADSSQMRFSARAKLWRARDWFAQTGLPVLSADPLYLGGGRGGPHNYCDLPAGPVRLGDLVQLCPYPNILCPVRLTGAEIRRWLEVAAGIFRQVRPGTGSAAQLIDPAHPSYRFVVLHGLSYQIDPSQPPGCGRIGRLTRDGLAVGENDRFVVLTSDHQMAELGRILGRRPELALGTPEMPRISSVLLDYLRAAQPVSAVPVAPVWRLSGQAGAKALFDTGPGAVAFQKEIGAFNPRPLGLTPDGFMRYRLTL